MPRKTAEPRFDAMGMMIEPPGPARPGRRVAKRAAESGTAVATLPRQPKPDWPWPIRPYQQDAYDAFQAGRRRQLLVWHRRAGKDIYAMSLARIESQRRIGGYVHFFPFHVQAKRAIWNGVDPRLGVRFIDHAFGDLVVATNKTDMLLDFENGSTWQMLGSDNYNRVIGSNIVGVVFSEWALCDPRAWDYIRPILRENKGWAVFITTFRGRNHAWQMAQSVKDNPAWYYDLRTVADTVDVDGNPILSDADIDADRAEGMSESLIRQEYYCDPDAAVDGAVYARQLDALREDPARLVNDWHPAHPVYACWDWQAWPTSATCVWLQLQPRPAILATRVFDFETVGEILADVRGGRYPVTHLLSERDVGMQSTFQGFEVWPNVVATPRPGVAEFATQTLLDRASMDPTANERLVNSLLGYVRSETASETDGALMFSDDYARSWHNYAVHALELGATWSHMFGPSWGRAPNYKIYDKRRV